MYTVFAWRIGVHSVEGRKYKLIMQTIFIKVNDNNNNNNKYFNEFVYDNYDSIRQN